MEYVPEPKRLTAAELLRRKLEAERFEVELAARSVPNSLVVFKQLGEKATTRVLAKHLGASMARAVRSDERPDVVEFPAPAEDQAAPTVYERIGIGALDLDQNGADALRDNPAVEAVVANERRSIPPILRAREIQTPAEAGAAKVDPFTWGLSATGAQHSAFSGIGIKIAVLDTGISHIPILATASSRKDRSFRESPTCRTATVTARIAPAWRPAPANLRRARASASRPTLNC